jgi:3-methyl-2-oxobutanoate hydroxymethyltransferase
MSSRTATRLSVPDIVAMKQRAERIAAVTAYDYTSAQILDAAGVHLILIGDTLGVVVQGANTTVRVSLEDVIYHARMVARGSQRALLVADMPFMTYQASQPRALRNAARLISQADVAAVKIEGGDATVCRTVQRLVRAGIPVCGHLGYTPQSAHALGRPRVQARRPDDALRLIREAKALEGAGIFALVLELVPESVAREITARIHVPTIGIGAGIHCDGEIQVFHDLFGLYMDFTPRHTQRYLPGAELIGSAASQYVSDVVARRFPGPAQSSDLSPQMRCELEQLLQPMFTP